MPRNRETNLEMRSHSRAAILGAARSLFAERGYANSTISEIARLAGMSQGNVYWYFTSKEELLKAVLADGFGALEMLLEKAATQPGSAMKKLSTLLDEYLLFARERGDFTTIFLSLNAQGGAESLRQLGFDTLQIGMRYHQHLTSIMVQGQGEGAIAGENPEILTMFFFAFFNGLMLTYRADWTKVPPDIVRLALFRLIGCSTEMA